MDDGTWGCGDELVAALSSVTEVLVDLPVSVCRLTGAELEVVLGVVDRLAAVAAAGRFTIAGEADARGEVAASQSGTLRQWVADRCPAVEARDAGVVAKAVPWAGGAGVGAGPGGGGSGGCRCRPGIVVATSGRSCGRWWLTTLTRRCWPGWSRWVSRTGVRGCGGCGRRCWPGTGWVR